MRQIGSVQTEAHLQRLVDYLLIRGIRSQADRAGGGWSIWVYDEDRVPEARAILERFEANPDDSAFVNAGGEADRLRSEAIAREKQIRKQIIDVRSQWTNRSAATRPLTILLIVVSVIVGFMTNFGEDRSDEGLIQRLSFAGYAVRGPYIEYYPAFGAKSDIRRGEVWRLITPIFLHFGPLHLLFNMMWLHSLGSVIEIRRGTIRFGLLILWLAVASNAAEYLWSGPTFGGMSGVVFGLFGYVWIKSRFDPSAGMYIDPGNVTMMLFWLVLCMTGLVGRIANAAHLMGLIGGVTVAFLPLMGRMLTGRRSKGR
jgi:GlpG protein